MPETDLDTALRDAALARIWQDCEAQERIAEGVREMLDAFADGRDVPSDFLMVAPD